MITVIVVGMMLNGLFVGHPLRIEATTEDCRTEMAVIQGVNNAHRGTGREWVAICIHEQITQAGQGS